MKAINNKQSNIIIENEQDIKPVSEGLLKLIKDTVLFSLKRESFETACEISILLVDDERICEINHQYRNIDSPTDVLSFPLVIMEEGSIISSDGDFDMDEGLLMLGDIVISLEAAAKQAEEYGHSYERELAFLVSHGCFHLLGYDHENDEQENKMLGRQEEVLSNMGLKRG